MGHPVITTNRVVELDTGNRAEWRRRTRVADPSPEGFTAWRRERERERELAIKLILSCCCRLQRPIAWIIVVVATTAHVFNSFLNIHTVWHKNCCETANSIPRWVSYCMPKWPMPNGLTSCHSITAIIIIIIVIITRDWRCS